MKICTREQPMHGAWYKADGLFRCQYCDGVIID